MGCCGQARAAMTPAYAPPPLPPREAPPRAPAATEAHAAPGTVRLHFTRPSGVQVRGPVTGASYAFPADALVQPVDARDADALLRTGYFRRAY